MRLILPERNDVYKTHPEDPIYNYYRLFTGYVFRKRLKLFLSLIDNGRKYARVLELGYGSGVFLPALARASDKLFALDCHKKGALVASMCAKEGIHCSFVRGVAQELPFKNDTFDLIVSVSMYQQTSEKILDASLAMVRDILKDDGVFICGLPVKNFITDSWLASEGFDPKVNAPISHNHLLSYMKKYFQIDRVLRFPAFLPLGSALYMVVKARRN